MILTDNEYYEDLRFIRKIEKSLYLAPIYLTNHMQDIEKDILEYENETGIFLSCLKPEDLDKKLVELGL